MPTTAFVIKLINTYVRNEDPRENKARNTHKQMKLEVASKQIPIKGCDNGAAKGHPLLL